MQRQRSVQLGVSRFLGTKPSLLLLLAGGLLLNCGQDEALDAGPTKPIEADGGDRIAGSGSSPVSGSSAGGMGQSGGNMTDAGEGPVLGGMPGGGSTQAGAPPGAGSGGDDDGPPQERLSFGLRIPEPFEKSEDVTIGYTQAVFDDCRTKWVTKLFLDKDEQPLFLNNLIDWNLDFWGCTLAAPPVSTFALIHEPAPLSAGDAALLIEHYITVATAELTLSPLEITEMRGALERLSRPLIVDPTAEPSQPDCGDPGSAGAGGAPGAAGAPPNEAAGQGGVQ
ncbi:MAG TPA: hypothetical protein VJN18_10905 [Polyangiaceae bacterium]|nr:hypothetical protein [Polyangiaceae bacterium]